MLDINGEELNERDLVQILCEIVSVDPEEGVKVRILNSEQELLVTVSQDEVLGLHTSPELSKFYRSPAATDVSRVDVFDSQVDGIKAGGME